MQRHATRKTPAAIREVIVSGVVIVLGLWWHTGPLETIPLIGLLAVSAGIWFYAGRCSTREWTRSEVPAPDRNTLPEGVPLIIALSARVQPVRRA